MNLATRKPVASELRQRAMNHSEIANFFWGVADLIRDTFKRGKYRDMILPLTVLRRLDSVSAATNEKALRTQMTCNAQLDNLVPLHRPASGSASHNPSRPLLDNQPRSASPDLLETVQIMERRQAWVREYLIDEGQDPLPFVRSGKLTDEPPAIAREMRQALGLERGWAAQQATWTNALGKLRHSMA